MVSARKFLNKDLDRGQAGFGPAAAAPVAAWQGFRLATINGAPLPTAAPQPRGGSASAPRLVPLAANAAGHPLEMAAGVAEAIGNSAARAVAKDAEGSLLWLGTLTCWMSALLTISMVVLAIR